MAADKASGSTGRDAIPADEREDGGEEVDVLFRAQMGITNFLLGYWKHLLGVLGLILAGVYAYSAWLEHTRDSQREIQAQMARIALEVPQPSEMALMGLAPLDDPSDSERLGAVRSAAEKYEALAKDGGGTGAVMAWFEAAELWERLGEAARARDAWKAAHELGPEGVMGWTAAANLASSLADEGDVDGAAAIYRAYADDPEVQGYLAERALFDLGQLYEGAGRASESQVIYGEFTERFPNSDLGPRVAEASRRVRDAG